MLPGNMMINYFEEIKKRNLFVSEHLEKINEKRIFLRSDTNSAVVKGNLDLDSYKLFAHAQTLKKYVLCNNEVAASAQV